MQTTLWCARALLPDGWADSVRLEWQDGVFTGIVSGAAAAPGERQERLVVPGLANVHSHAFQRAMAGLAERRGPTADSFWTWREVMYRFVDHLQPDDVAAIAMQAYVEMLESGFTRVGEFHYLHHDPVGQPYADPAELAGRHVAAAIETGIGLTLLPSFYAHAGFGGRAPVHGQRRFITTLDGFAALLEAARGHAARLPGARVGVAPHSLRAVTPDELRAVAALAGDGPVHIHAAEQVQEVTDCVAWSGLRPVQWLLEHAEVSKRWCVIHATHLVPDELSRLAASGAVAGLCPLTEANLGDGIFDTAAWLGVGGALGIGSDSNICIDAAQELRALESAQRLAHRARNVLALREGHSTGRQLHDAAVRGGAQALGVAGGLTIGAPADAVALDAAHPALAGRDDDAWLDSWIFAARDRPVHAVWSAGALVVDEGRHRAGERIAARYRSTVTRLLQG